MSNLQDKDPRFKRLEVKIGLMSAIAIAGIILIIALVGIERDLFTAKYNIYFISGSGTGFIEGMPVKLSGFKIGRVRKIELTDEARVKVTAEINKKYEKWLREGSKARLSKEGFIGDSFIEMTMGKPGARPVAEGEMVPYEKTGGIEELVEEAKPILQEVKDIIHYVNSPDGDIKATLKNVKELTAELKETRRTIDKTIQNAGSAIKNSGPAVESAKKAMENLETVTKKLEPVMTKIESIADKTDSFATRLPATAEKFDRILGNVERTTGALSDETPRIKEILKDTGDTAREGKAVIKGIKESWPVRLMVPEPKKPELIPLDGYVQKDGARKN